MVYNSYNSNLIISHLEYEENTDRTYLHFYIFDIKSLSIINRFDIDSKYYEQYNLNILNEYILNEYILIIVFNSVIIYIISLKTNQVITIIEVFNNNVDNGDFYYSEIHINFFNFKNEKKFVIFNHYKIKLFRFYPPYEIIEEVLNDEKYKDLELDS